MLDITVSIAQGMTIVGLEGALVRGEGDHLIELVAWLHEFGERHVTLHAAGVKAVDTAGLMALMQCHDAFIGSGDALTLAMPSGQLRLALRRTGLDTVLRIVDRPAAAPLLRA